MYCRLQVPSPLQLLEGFAQRLFVFFVGHCHLQMGREMHLSSAPFRNQVSLRCCPFCTMSDCHPSLTSSGLSIPRSCKFCAGHSNATAPIFGQLKAPLQLARCRWIGMASRLVCKDKLSGVKLLTASQQPVRASQALPSQCQ